jgi:hypothetical protein
MRTSFCGRRWWRDFSQAPVPRRLGALGLAAGRCPPSTVPRTRRKVWPRFKRRSYASATCRYCRHRTTGRDDGLIPPARPRPLSYACGSGGVPGGGCGLGKGSGLGAGSGRSGLGGSDGGAGGSGVGSGVSGCEGSLISTSTLGVLPSTRSCRKSCARPSAVSSPAALCQVGRRFRHVAWVWVPRRTRSWLAHRIGRRTRRRRRVDSRRQCVVRRSRPGRRMGRRPSLLPNSPEQQPHSSQ